MKVDIFSSTKQSDLFAATQDAAGTNLDPALGPWEKFKQVTLTAGEKRAALDADAAIAGINKTGVFYWTASVRADGSTAAPGQP